MAHKPLIDGTAYEISGGKTLIGGTAYSIKNGKTLVNGTAYEIEFQPTITITGSGYSDSVIGGGYIGCYVEVDGIRYLDATELSLPVGTEIQCTAYGAGTTHPSEIILNGTTIKTSGQNETYDYVVTKNATINLSARYISNAGAYGTISITEQ